MLKSLALACAFAAATAVPAFAQSECSPPEPPSMDNLTTLKQIADASHYANQFMKDLDDYQSCVAYEENAAKADAKKNKKDFDPSPWKIKADASQDLKKKIHDEFQAAFKAFCKQNPNADPSCAKVQ